MGMFDKPHKASQASNGRENIIIELQLLATLDASDFGSVFQECYFLSWPQFLIHQH
jgi:hypothetical protein